MYRRVRILQGIIQGIGNGVLIAVTLIVILEICRIFRSNTSLSREIDDLKEKVRNIEEQLNNLNK
jgi:uncharacterized protein YeeX (DUF496 family)